MTRGGLHLGPKSDGVRGHGSQIVQRQQTICMTRGGLHLGPKSDGVRGHGSQVEQRQQTICMTQGGLHLGPKSDGVRGHGSQVEQHQHPRALKARHRNYQDRLPPWPCVHGRGAGGAHPLVRLGHGAVRMQGESHAS